MASLFGLIDCARDPSLIRLVKRADHASLFAGRQDPAIEAVSPFVVDLVENVSLVKHWRENGWGQSWGVLVHSTYGVEDLRKHFRKFLLAQLPDARKVMFRFYDPRVLRPYLPTCTPQELAQWFDKVAAFVLEGEGVGTLSYRFDGTTLVTREG